MDLTRDVLYRGFLLNDSSVEPDPGLGIGDGIAGCVLDSADFSDVDVIQFTEKRSLQDGMDAGDVFLGARRLRIAGTLYGQTRNLLFDAYWSLRAALSPVLAQRESPADKGYLPLYFSVPTNRVSDYPTGTIDLMVRAMPRSIQALFDRDRTGGSDADSLAIPFQATLVMKDPAILGETPQDTAFSATSVITGATATASTNLINKTSHGLTAGTAIYLTAKTGGTGLSLNTVYYVLSSGLVSGAFKVGLTAGGSIIDITSDASVLSYALVQVASGNFSNRGTYLAPLNALFVVGAQAGTITITAGGVQLTITVPVSTGDRTIRYKGQDKILTVEEADNEELRMDLLTLDAQATHPQMPAGLSPYDFTFAGVVLKADSHTWFWEQYA